MAMLLVWANVLNRCVPAFTEAQRLLEDEDSVVGRVIRNAKNRKTTDIALGTEFGRPKQMYRLVLTCSGIPARAGPSGPRDISEEFTHRPWHKNVSCRWYGSLLILQADNDFDSNGLALMDEFSDAISACIKNAGDGDINVVTRSASSNSWWGRLKMRFGREPNSRLAREISAWLQQGRLFYEAAEFLVA